MIKQKIREKLNDLVASYLKNKNIDENLKFSIEVPPENINADFATNAAMLIAKKIKINPKLVGEELVDKILKEMPELIEKADIAGAGFINLHIKHEVLYNELITILTQKEDYGKVLNSSNKKVIVEFVSANPTGPLHIGHGRGAAIGDSLSRILKHLGYNVVKEYYLNDVGNQMLVLAKSTELRYRQLKGEQIEFPQDHYQGSYITDIAKRLILEGKDIKDIDFRAESVKDILKTIENDLRNFSVDFDNWFSEATLASVKNSSGQTQVDKACQYFLEKGDAYIKDNALWLASTKFGDDKDRVLKRSDGRYTYLASDVAYHKNKFERGFSKLVNIWGADHHGYVARIKACIQMLGFDQHNLNIILYQLVSLVRNGSPIVMSTRSGEFITLKEVIDEVGKDVCRFFFLLRSPDSPLEFDLDLAKKQSNENPVFYVQYVSARCNSIIKESKNRKDIVNDINNIDLTLLNTKEEKDLIKQLSAFCDTLFLSEKLMSPHCFTSYLIDLADKYHAFYEKCRVLSEDTNLTSSRLKLVESVMIVIRNGLNLLGVSCPEKM
ncbi:MAG: arginine--tRNA ligase [Endomicrobium sp.]|jgi:arginyl-tRNA synthetase|nr:arginine--tRNA ligase [Endomicrobium sp.]